MNVVQQKVFEELDRLGIAYETIEHPAVFTVAEADALRTEKKGMGLKNLFLRDDKGKRYFLVSIRKEKMANMEDLQRKLESRRLSFASEAKLKELLGLEKGSVTPFGLLNDTDRRVEFVLDADISPDQWIGAHPNQNTATVWLAAKDLERVVAGHGNRIIRVPL